MDKVKNLQEVIATMTKMEQTVLFYWLRHHLAQNMTAEEKENQELFDEVVKDVFHKNEEVLKELAK